MVGIRFKHNRSTRKQRGKKREIVGKNFEKIMDHKKVNTEFDTIG